MGQERRFSCTACGKCCVGWLPLTMSDALLHAHRFPLAVIWSPVRQGARAFEITAKLGMTVRLKGGKRIAVRIVPTVYLPASMPCPALSPSGLCSIHESKPLRCRTMPFYPYRDEDDQSELLVARSGWLCDVGDNAPVVYRNKKIVDPAAFDAELGALRSQAEGLRAYAEDLMARVPGIFETLVQTALKPAGGHVVRSFSSLLVHWCGIDIPAVAARQKGALETYIEKTADSPECEPYNRYFRTSAQEMARLMER